MAVAVGVSDEPYGRLADVSGQPEAAQIAGIGIFYSRLCFCRQEVCYFAENFNMKELCRLLLQSGAQWRP